MSKSAQTNFTSWKQQACFITPAPPPHAPSHNPAPAAWSQSCTQCWAPAAAGSTQGQSQEAPSQAPEAGTSHGGPPKPSVGHMVDWSITGSTQQQGRAHFASADEVTHAAGLLADDEGGSLSPICCVKAVLTHSCTRKRWAAVSVQDHSMQARYTCWATQNHPRHTLRLALLLMAASLLPASSSCA